MGCELLEVYATVIIFTYARLNKLENLFVVTYSKVGFSLTKFADIFRGVCGREAMQISRFELASELGTTGVRSRGSIFKFRFSIFN